MILTGFLTCERQTITVELLIECLKSEGRKLLIMNQVNKEKLDVYSMINNLAFIRSAEGVQKWMSERN